MQTQRRILRCIVVVAFMAMQVSPSFAAKVKPKKVLKQEWTQVTTANFDIISNAKPELLKTLAVDLENFREFLSKVMGIPQKEGRAPVKFLILKNKSTFDALGFRDNVAGIFRMSPEGFFSVANGEDFNLRKKKPSYGSHVIKHEMVHYFMSNQQSKQHAPLWFNEGIAEYLGTMVRSKNQVKFGDWSILKWNFYELANPTGRGFESVDLEQLFKARRYFDPKAKNKKQRQRATTKFYARSFITVHYFYADPERRKQLFRYIELLNKDFDEDEAFAEVFQKSYEALTEEVDKYLTSRNIYAPVYTLKEGKTSFKPVKPTLSKVEPKEGLYRALSVRLRFGYYDEGEGVALKNRNRLLDSYYSAFPDTLQSLFLKNRFDSRVAASEVLPVFRAVLDKAKTAKKSEQLSDKIMEELYLNVGLAEEKLADQKRRVGNPDWLGHNRKARVALRKVVKLNELNIAAYQSLAESYRYTPYDEATFGEGAVCYDITNLFTNVESNYQQLGNYYMAQGKYREALVALKHYVNVAESQYSRGFATWVRDALGLHFIADLDVQTETQSHILFTNGASYEGDIKDFLPHGSGTFSTPKGIKYSGDWKRGLPHGKGKFVASNEMQYEGDFVEGAVHGKGVLVYPKYLRGMRYYRGEFFRYMEHGEGRALWSDGIVSEGGFYRGRRHGMHNVEAKDGSGHKLEYVWGSPKIAISDDVYFVGRIDYASMKPKLGAKGRCVRGAEFETFACKFDAGEIAAVE